jgi:hypothetical protein
VEIVEKIKNIGLPDKEFVVMGSAILEAKGIRKAGDLDVMVKKALFDELKKKPGWKYTHKVGKLGDSIDLLENNGVQLYFSIYGKEDYNYFLSEPTRIEEIDGIYFTSLKDLLRKKSTDWDREKDKQDVELIKAYLATV